MRKYEFLEHTADIKFRVYGKTINEIFENAALAFSELVSRGVKIKSRKKKKIKVNGEDRESLLHNFLDELIYLLDAENFIVKEAKIKLKNNMLYGEVLGDDVANYSNLDHVKAATYAEMYIRENKGRWEAQVVVDV